MIESLQSGQIPRFKSAAQESIEHLSRCLLHAFLSFTSIEITASRQHCSTYCARSAEDLCVSDREDGHASTWTSVSQERRESTNLVCSPEGAISAASPYRPLRFCSVLPTRWQLVREVIWPRSLQTKYRRHGRHARRDQRSGKEWACSRAGRYGLPLWLTTPWCGRSHRAHDSLEGNTPIQD
jgi:hypothetical protein